MTYPKITHVIFDLDGLLIGKLYFVVEIQL